MKIKKELITQRDSKSPISEIFRTLRTNIQFMSTNKKMKTLLITSTVPGEGKSWVASNLAVTFAQAGNKVILIDADMRKGRQYSIFGVPPKPGLSNFLSDADENEKVNVKKYIRKTEIENLLVMPTGSIPPNPSELLVAPQMVKLLGELKESFDIIIIDGTPCELVTDSVILSSITDSTLIVTAYKSTRKDSLERIVKNIQNVGGNLVGVVVNKMPMSAKKYYGSYSSKDGKYSRGNKNTKAKDNAEPNKKTNTCSKCVQKKNKSTNRKTSVNKDISVSRKKTSNEIKQNIEKNHKEIHNKSNKDLEKPYFLKDKMNTEKTSNRTKDILDQMNLYYNEEKKK